MVQATGAEEAAEQDLGGKRQEEAHNEPTIGQKSGSVSTYSNQFSKSPEKQQHSQRESGQKSRPTSQ